VVVTEFDTTRFANVEGILAVTLDKRPPSPRYKEAYTFDVNTAFEAFTSVKVPTPIGKEKAGAVPPEREKLISTFGTYKIKGRETVPAGLATNPHSTSEPVKHSRML
jgi:hypothetical protein